MQRNGYRAQYLNAVDADFSDVFDLIVRSTITFTTATPIFTVAYRRPGTYVFDGYMFVRDATAETFTMTVLYVVTDAAAVVQLVVDVPLGANNTAGQLIVNNAAGGTTGVIPGIVATANFARVVRLHGLFQIVAPTAGTFELQLTAVGAGAFTVRIGSRLRGARMPD